MLNADSVATLCGIKSRLVLTMEKLGSKCKCFSAMYFEFRLKIY